MEEDHGDFNPTWDVDPDSLDQFGQASWKKCVVSNFEGKFIMADCDERHNFFCENLAPACEHTEKFGRFK